MSERTQELNDRIYDRNVISNSPPIYFSPRSVPTKYTTMPMLDHKLIPNVMIHPSSFTSKDFLPGTHGPYFSSHVDEESILRNVGTILQASSQFVYVPSSKSDLYVTAIAPKPVEQPHPYLFQRVETSQSCSQVPYPFNPVLFNQDTHQAILDCPR
jgi:hypothetical protein